MRGRLLKGPFLVANELPVSISFTGTPQSVVDGCVRLGSSRGCAILRRVLHSREFLSTPRAGVSCSVGVAQHCVAQSLLAILRGGATGVLPGSR